MVKRLSSGVVIVALLAAVAVLWVLAFQHTYADPPASRGSLYTPPPEPKPQPLSVWIGDSFTEGTGANSSDSAESCLTAQKMGWDCGLDAQGGTGFIANGHAASTTFEPISARLAEDADWSPTPDVVVIDAGRNDRGQPWTKLRPVVHHFFTHLVRTFPDAQVVVVAPYFMDGTQALPQYADYVRTLLKPHGGVVINPIAEGWISRDTATMTIEDGHPDQAGHTYIAEHLAADLNRLGVHA